MRDLSSDVCSSDLEGWYGESHVLHGVAFDVREGEVVTLLGRDGAGKTSTLKAIMGILPRREGSIVFEGRELIKLPARAIARLGISYCPEERGIFRSEERRVGQECVRTCRSRCSP